MWCWQYTAAVILVILGFIILSLPGCTTIDRMPNMTPEEFCEVVSCSIPLTS